jgi:serine/threonine protein kinase
MAGAMQAEQTVFFGFDIEYTAVKSLKHLADGGMCHIYTGELQGTKVVLKFPIRNSEKYSTSVKDLELELQLLQLMHHPHIISLYGAGKTPEGDMFICLEHLDGG